MNTPRELAQKVKFRDVYKALHYFYKGKWSYAEKVFNRIKDAPKKAHRNKAEFIEVICINEMEDGEYGSWYQIHTNLFSLSFRKWDEISNIPISDETLKYSKACEVLAQLIYEMTWYGMEKEAMKMGKGLLKTAREAKRDYIKKNK